MNHVKPNGRILNYCRLSSLWRFPCIPPASPVFYIQWRKKSSTRSANVRGYYYYYYRQYNIISKRTTITLKVVIPKRLICLDVECIKGVFGYYRHLRHRCLKKAVRSKKKPLFLCILMHRFLVIVSDSYCNRCEFVDQWPLFLKIKNPDNKWFLSLSHRIIIKTTARKIENTGLTN